MKGRRPRDPPGTRGRLGLGENNSVSLIESPFPASPVGHNETFSEINADDEEAEPFGSDELFYGSIPVYFKQVPGETLVYTHSEWMPLDDAESLKTTLSRTRKMGPKADIVVPAIPALEIGQRELNPNRQRGGMDDSDDELEEGHISQWPLLLRKPLIKVPADKASLRGALGPKAFASGVRSALIKLNSKWYRLKGSGNNDEGFIVRTSAPSKKGEKPWRDVRGSAFFHTALRENYMTAAIAHELEPQGILGANTSMGLYEYGVPNQPLGPEFPLACIVEGTRGDRRLGTHVLSGVQLLLPLLLEEGQLDLETLKNAFPEPRRDIGTPSTDAFLTDHMLATEMIMQGFMDPASHGLDFNIPRDETSLAAGHSLFLPHKAPAPGQYPVQWMRGDQPNKDMDPRWHALWDQTVVDLAAYLNSQKRGDATSVLGYLFSRIGNDCGRFLAALHRMRISWGTYQDEMCYDGQWHCNAHANNMVLLEEGSSPTMMFGYLDLDMAFDDSTFVHTATGEVGIASDVHDKLLHREHINFMEVLAGSDSTNGVPQVAKAQVEAHSPALKLATTVLYDTLILGYLRGYTGEERFPVAEVDPELQKAAYAVMKLACMVMADYVA